MAWAILIVSGVLEAVWATALGASDGFTRRSPTMLFVASLALSMVGLAIAMSSLPVGTSYAVWVGVGAVLTAAWAIATKKEKANLPKVLLLTVLIASVAALKVMS